MPRNWISIHIFYYGDQNELLVNCLAPLVDTFRAQKWVQHAFFIRYWLEGPHIRLRLLPAPGVDEAEIKRVAEQTLALYLKNRPALFSPDAKSLAPIYRKMFLSEYREEKWNQLYGEGGEMPLRENNSFHYIAYEPEYDRYGGVEGVALSEWHFEQSSDLILELLREVNVRVSSILLGTSVQLFLPLFYGFFADDEAVINALDDYIKFWQNIHGEGWSRPGRTQTDTYEKHYARMARDLQQRVLEIKEYMTQEHNRKLLTPIESAWKAHILELRQRVDALFAEGKLTFDALPQDWLPGPFDLQTAHYRRLLGSYVHMTNNRLGVSIYHEIYLAYLVKRALEDLTYRFQEGIA